MSDKWSQCQECGMTVLEGAYHPYAACLMFTACGDGRTVEDNLSAITSKRIRDLQAEVARISEINTRLVQIGAKKEKEAKAAEAKLRAVGGLRRATVVFDDFSHEYVVVAPRGFAGDVVSVDELEAVLKDTARGD